MNQNEIKKLKATFVPFYPDWLLRILSADKYNKTFNIKGITLTSKHITIAILVAICLIMFAFQTICPTIMWIGAIFFMFWSLCILGMIGLNFYNNKRIKTICKLNGITLEQWNLA